MFIFDEGIRTYLFNGKHVFHLMHLYFRCLLHHFYLNYFKKKKERTTYTYVDLYKQMNQFTLIL